MVISDRVVLRSTEGFKKCWETGFFCSICCRDSNFEIPGTGRAGDVGIEILGRRFLQAGSLLNPWCA